MLIAGRLPGRQSYFPDARSRELLAASFSLLDRGGHNDCSSYFFCSNETQSNINRTDIEPTYDRYEGTKVRLNMPNLNFPKSGPSFYFPHSSISDILDDKPVAIGLGILVIGLIALLLHSPGPAEYTITSEGVAIHGGSYSDTLNAAGIDVEHIQIVDLGKDTHWRPTSQFGISGHSARYRTGYWRVAGGEKVLLYQAGGKRLVLLPPKGKGNPVLLEVKKPEVFIQELRQAWR